MTATLSRPAPSTVATKSIAISMVVWIAVVVVAIGMAPLDAAFSSDDGAYGIGVRSLADDGRWVLDRPVPVVPVANEGLVNGWRTEAGPIAYPNHPVYVQILRVGTGLLGDPMGLRLAVFVGALLVPLLAWRVAATNEQRWPLAAFWLAALSPLPIHALGLWAHAPSAAVAGGTILVVARTRRRPPTALDIAAVAVLSAFGVLLRREMLLWAVALVVGWLVLRWSRRTVLAASTTLVAAAVAVAGERTMQSQLAENRLAAPIAGNEPMPWLQSRIEAAWHVLFDPSHVGGPVAALALLGAALVIGGATVVRRGDRQAGGRLVVAGIVLLAMRLVVGEAELTSGIVVAWPAAVAGVIVGWRPTGFHRFLTVTVVLFAAAVLVTQHADGGGLEWGGRYFSPALVAVAVLAGDGLASLIGADRRLRVSMVLALLLPVAAGVMAADHIRERNADVVAYVDQFDSSVVITDQPALPRVAWSTVPDTAWYLASVEDLDDLLEVMADAEVDAVTVQGFDGLDVSHPAYVVSDGQPGLVLLRHRG